MPGSPATGFVIRTASGDKGPFTAEQIAAFVAKGKLPATAKIFDLAAQRPVAAGAVGAVRDEDQEVTLVDERPVDIDTEAETPPAPGLRAPSSASSRGRRAAERAPTKTMRKPGVGARGGPDSRRATGRMPRKRRSRWKGPVIALVVVLAIGAVATVLTLNSMKEDRFAHQGETLLAQTLEHPEAVGAGGADEPFTKILIKRDHADALAAAKLPRGTYDGGKPAYDEARYRETLKAAIAKQAGQPDSALLTACAKELAAADAATPGEIACAKKLAQQAVTMDAEKNHLSLDALAWATFRSGDAKRAALIEEQAASLAPDTASKTECEKARRKFTSKNPGAKTAEE